MIWISMAVSNEEAFLLDLLKLPEFWQNTFLSNPWLGNPVWNWLIAAIIVLTALFLRKPISKLTESIAVRMDHDEHRLAYTLVVNLAPAVRLLVLAIGLSIALQSGLLTFPEPGVRLIQQVMDTIKAIILYISLVGIGTGLLSLSTEKARADGDKSTVTIHTFYQRAIHVAAFIVCAFMILKVWGFDISGLLAGLGIGGLALSLAAQDTFSNLLAGLTIMTDHSFSIGDVISTPDVEGVVEDIGFRSSKVRTFTQALVTVPNSKLSNNTVTNLSQMTKRRIRFTIGLEYGITPDQIRNLILKLREKMAAREVLEPESILICLEKFSDSSIDLLIQCFLKTADFSIFLKEQESILMEVMDIMAEENLQFAFKAVAVHCKKDCKLSSEQEKSTHS